MKEKLKKLAISKLGLVDPKDYEKHILMDEKDRNGLLELIFTFCQIVPKFKEIEKELKKDHKSEYLFKQSMVNILKKPALNMQLLFHAFSVIFPVEAAKFEAEKTSTEKVLEFILEIVNSNVALKENKDGQEVQA